MQYIFLSHDVDWRKQGPPLEHILARKDRFEPELFEKTKPEDLYHNIPEYMEIEEEFGVRSTFSLEHSMKMAMYQIMKMTSNNYRNHIGRLGYIQTHLL